MSEIINKLDEVEELAKELEIDWDAAFDLVYGTDYYGREDETDDAI